MSITDSMISLWILVGVAVLASGSPQSRGMAISFPGEHDADTDHGGLEEFYDNPDAKLYLPGNPDDSYDGDGDYFSRSTGDLAYGSYEDAAGANSEPFTFVSEEDYLELPDWMNIDFNKLPLDKLQLLNNASDLTDLAAFFDLDQENADKLSLSEQQTNGTQTESRSAGLVENNYEKPVFARCEPERVKVVLEVAKNSRYLPSCVRLMRCGGCCNNDELLSCQATKSTVISIKVLKITMSKSSRSRRTRSIRSKRSRRGRGRGRRTSGMLVTLPEENHLECSCQCKVQERDCDPAVHKYNKDVCACYCKEEAKKQKCLQNSSLQMWDSKSCTCLCRTVKKCGNGELFSKGNCRCIAA